MTQNFTEKQITVLNAVQLLQDHCHEASSTAGWWTDKQGNPVQNNPFAFSNKLMLTVSEIAEAMEADRKDLMDDHLPHLKGTACELADAVIRIMDLAGAYKLDLAGALVEKMAYNVLRKDHQKATRDAVGGKSY